jgi:nicotinamide-nucleotide amidase
MRPLRSAEVIAVGSELLTPSRLDTNSLFLADRLRAIGILLRTKAVVGDRADDLDAVLRASLGRSDLVVLTGGLGPTDDDLTRTVVAAALKRPLHEDTAISESIRQRFARRALTMPEINRRQAMVPEGATVLPNAHGTAPGLYLEVGEHVVVLLPGPPRELEPMFDAVVRDHLRARTAGTRVYTRIVRVFGRSESHTEEAVRPFYGPWASMALPIEVTILAARGAIDLHLTVNAPDETAAGEVLVPAVRQVVEAIGDDVYSDDGEAIEQVLARQVTTRGWRIGVAESCTGGLIAKRLTDFPGSSAFVEGGVVSYSNAMKTRLLGVPEALLAAHGAVSEPVAEAMADGIRARSSAEVGISVTGIAGPDGGTAAKPVGTVVFAVVTPDARVVRTRTYPSFGRELVRDVASHAALDMARRLIAGLRVP